MKYSTPTLDINLNAVKQNYLTIKKFCNKSEICGTVKASSYGLGGHNKIVTTLKNVGCKRFFVANINEGIFIRKKFKSIIINILNGLNRGEEKILYNHNLNPVINTISQLKKWLIFTKNKRKNKLVIHFDTGMCRLGIQENQITEVLKLKDQINKFKEVIIMSHLACASDKKNNFNEEQRKKFEKIRKTLPGYKYSLAASGGIFLGKKYHYDLVRPGINLYGGSKSLNSKIKHVVSLKAPIIQINNLKKGKTVGYSRTFKAKRDSITATIPMGYADGIGIRLSNKGYVHFKNKKIPMIGRVSMDLIILDITKFKNKIKVGDFVEVYNDKFTIDNFANLTGTIPYRIITCISKRYLRNYKN